MRYLSFFAKLRVLQAKHLLNFKPPPCKRLEHAIHRLMACSPRLQKALDWMRTRRLTRLDSLRGLGQGPTKQTRQLLGQAHDHVGEVALGDGLARGGA